MSTSHAGYGVSPALRGCMGQFSLWPMGRPQVHFFLSLFWNLARSFCNLVLQSQHVTLLPCEKWLWRSAVSNFDDEMSRLHPSHAIISQSRQTCTKLTLLLRKLDVACSTPHSTQSLPFVPVRLLAPLLGSTPFFLQARQHTFCSLYM